MHAYGKKEKIPKQNQRMHKKCLSLGSPYRLILRLGPVGNNLFARWLHKEEREWDNSKRKEEKLL